MSRNYASAFYNPWLIFLLLIDFLLLEFYYEEFLNKLTNGYLLWPYQPCGWDFFFMVGFIFLLAVIISGKVKNKYKLSSSTLRQLINNALGYKWLTLFILFFFMMHFSWTIDAGYDIFLKIEFDEVNWMDLCRMIVPGSGMIVAALLIPVYQKEKKSLSEADILLSSFSVSYDKETKVSFLQLGNFDLFFKPFRCGVYNTLKTIEKLEGINKILVVPSTFLPEVPIRMNSADEAAWKDFCDEMWRQNEKIQMAYNQQEEYFNKVKTASKEYNKATQAQKLESMKVLLSTIWPANYIFSDKLANYDNFDDMFGIASQLLKRHECSDSRTLIHISPGTSIPTGVLTALGVKRNRTIIYTSQDKSEDNFGKVYSVDINVDNLSDWFSDLVKDKETK